MIMIRIDEDEERNGYNEIRSMMMIRDGSSKHDVDSLTSDSFESLSVKDCIYRGEGNANIVVTLMHEQKVIRFRKSLPRETLSDNNDDDEDVDENDGNDDEKIRVKREAEFVRHVVSGYLGSYVRVPEIVRYDAKDVTKLLEIIRPFRSEKRKYKKKVKIYAMKMPDYTFLPSMFAKLDHDLFKSKSTFAVEIKPKQGYQRKEEQRLQKCPYCLAQYYKFNEKMIDDRSSYCPFDLFSGDVERMNGAIKGLLRSPQNNLKIFKDGTIVYDQEFSTNDLETVLNDFYQTADISTKDINVNLFSNLICAILLHSYPQSKRSELMRAKFKRNRFYHISERDNEVIRDTNEKLLSKTRKLFYLLQEECKRESNNDLPKDCILERILSMQRLPYVGTEHIYDIYDKHSTVINDEIIYSHLINSSWNYTKEEHKDTNGNHTDNWPSTTSKIKENIELIKNTDQWKENISYYNDKLIDKSNNDNIEYKNDKISSNINNKDLIALQNYLLFCTARDCSILITFRQLKPEALLSVPQEYVIKISKDLCFLTSVNVTDLDPKSMHSIKRHRQRDIDILNAVISVLKEELSLNDHQ
ncbi:inositol-pentakisphosphate 2-kinase-like [Vespa mandarinia]|uniref:inositol-pentakisphosphate 2-kinase-like n=1 Tax=Vespa mandarinia TaxID=7446 RepID=UPI00161035B1|nr:inositol-pentakisphosphate 2-kinase-like [Vespa mandarinia]XP_035742461.1 inositol-pentakisphosphate 2-kinase-like [Vespa mandarinia]XP_035742463.1 inositol-pentakisphosphate 2-kinase-like [Vespa mandarinia]XP_035742464.1 inositol-pentakisphosphate 2-kinase-like [Vespa mandarinia]